jgi:hypothetical protein
MGFKMVMEENAIENPYKEFLVSILLNDKLQIFLFALNFW